MILLDNTKNTQKEHTERKTMITISFYEATGYTPKEYVKLSIPAKNPEVLPDFKIQELINKMSKVIQEALPIGYTYDGEHFLIPENDECPIGYPSQDGIINLAALVDQMDFEPVNKMYRNLIHPRYADS